MKIRNDFSGIKAISDFLKNDSIFIEIGVYSGDASEIFLKSNKIKKYYAIDPWINNYDKNDSLSIKGNMEKAEKDFDKKTFLYKDNIVKLKMKSNDAIKHIKEKIDCVYIDGLHSYEGVKQDIINYYPIIKDEGIISGHDYCKTWKGVIKAVNEMLGEPDYIYSDGSWVIFKNTHKGI